MTTLKTFLCGVGVNHTEISNHWEFGIGWWYGADIFWHYTNEKIPDDDSGYSDCSFAIRIGPIYYFSYKRRSHSGAFDPFPGVTVIGTAGEDLKKRSLVHQRKDGKWYNSN